MANSDLFLYDQGDLVTPVASSVSTVDNVEHLFLVIPAQGHYTLAVRATGVPIDPLTYSLAWALDVPEIDLEGDYNQDGIVDAADYVVWRKNEGTQQGYNLWQTHFGETAGGGAGPIFATDGPVSVPEPAVWLWIVATICCRLFPLRPVRNDDKPVSCDYEAAPGASLAVGRRRPCEVRCENR